jgi:hypothetical protein
MINYDNVDLNDPQLDFDTEQAMLVDALKGAKELQKPQFTTYRGQGNVIAPWSPGSSIGNLASNLAGTLDQQRVQGDMRKLNQEEGRRYDQGINELNKIDPNVDYTNPASIEAAHNQRQIALMQLSRLPMARKMAEGGFLKTSPLADALAKQKMGELFKDDQLGKNLATRQDIAQLVAQTSRANNADSNATRITIADTRQEKPDKEAQKLAAKQPGEFTRVNNMVSRFGELDADIGELLDNKEGLESASGIIMGNIPNIMQKTKLAEDKLGNIKSKLLREGKNLLSESGKPGSISVQEWPIFEKMVADMKTGTQTENLLNQIATVQAYIDSRINDAREGYENTYGVLEEGKSFKNIKDESKRIREARTKYAAQSGGATVPMRNSALPLTTGQSQTNTTEPQVVGQRTKGGVVYNIYDDGTAEPAGGQ